MNYSKRIRECIAAAGLLVACTLSLPGMARAESVEAPTFSVSHGLYTTPFDLTIASAAPNAVIRYTLDGSDPRFSSTARQVNSPAVVRIDPESTYAVRGKNPGVVVRACASSAGLTISEAAAHTYLFVAKVASLSREGIAPGPGWPQPTANANPQAFDYGMSPVILNDARYKNLIDTALRSVPSISISTDQKYLFSSDSGIYMNAMQDDEAWERPASIELLKTDNVEGFQINAGLRIRGGWSRHGDNPKHAFRFFFRTEYGKGKLSYPLFENEGVAKFDKMDLRTGQNYAWSYPGHSGHYNTMITEVFCRDLQRDMGQPYTRSRFYHLYLNGVYWGLYQTQERSEAKFAASYFGGSDDDYDVIKINDSYGIEATDGTLDAYREVWNMCTTGFRLDSNYYKLQGMDANGVRNISRKNLVDVDNLIDYMLIIFYSGNFDSPVSKFGQNKQPNNFYSIYNRKLNDGFKFYIHDAEHALRTTAGEGPGIGLNENRVNIGTLTDGNKMTVTDFTRFHPQWLHFRLSDNAEYRMRFADRVYKHFYNKGSLTPARSAELFRSRAKEIEMAIIAESARWGNTYMSPAATKDDDWKPAVDDILNNYIPYRFAIVLNQFRAASLYPAIDPPLFQRNGEPMQDRQFECAAGTAIVIQRPLYESGTVYYTRNGSDPRKAGGTVSPSAINAGSETVISVDTTIILKARVLDGSVWSALHELTLVVTPGMTAVRDRSQELPSEIGLQQNYPNPFNPSTTIRYAIPHAGRVTIAVYNTLGEQIAVLADGTMPPGTHEVVWNASAFPSGLYYCRMFTAASGRYASVKKLVLMK